MEDSSHASAEIRYTPQGLPFVRTPEDRFAGVEGFDYKPAYVEVDGLRMAYVKAGPSPAKVTLLLQHGEPTWGYLYHKMIPPLAEAGFQVLVPDLLGFGRSDKPTQREAYTYAGHVEWMRRFVQATDSVHGDSELVLFGQDWGGLIGLRLAAENPGMFDRLILSNTALPVGESPSAGFDFWRQFSQEVEFLDCGRLIANTAATKLTNADYHAYRAPFPGEEYMAGARQFPLLVPVTPDDPAVSANRAAWAELEQFTKPVLTLWAPGDTVLGDLQHMFAERIPGAKGQPHAQFEPAGHFIQQDQGPAVAAAIIDWLSN